MPKAKDEVEELLSPQSEEKEEKEEKKGEPSKSSEPTFTLPWVKDEQGNPIPLTAEQVREEALKMNVDYTQKTQKLADLEKTTEQTAKEKEDELLKQELKRLGVVTKEDLEAERARIRGELTFEQKLTALEKEIDGSDGRPPFRREEIVSYMQKPETKIFDPKKAYEDLYQTKLDEWKIQQFLKARQEVPAAAAEKGGSTGVHVPTGEKKPIGKLTDDELKQTILEELQKPKE